ncbi:MAG: transcriptional regulator [Bacteroidota bacterium]
MTPEDIVIDQLKHVPEALALMFGSHCEVVLHDLRNPEHSIVAIANGHISGRKIGGPIIGGPLPDKGLDVLQEPGDFGYLANYETQTSTGKRLRSTTMLFRGKDGRPFAALCINYDLTPFMAIKQVVDSFCDIGGPGIAQSEREDSASQNDVGEIISEIIRESIRQLGKPVSMMDKQDKLEAVRVMKSRGLFLVRGSVERAARALRVSRFTIYNYLDELKSVEAEQDTCL